MQINVQNYVSGRRWWLGVLVVYGLTRLALLPAFVLAWRNSDWWPENYLGPDPTWWTLISRGWDGHWYEEIATEGYPDSFPRDPESGLAEESAWAFFPAFPSIIRAVMAITRMPWDVAAPTLSWVLGYFALCLVFLLIRSASMNGNTKTEALPFISVMAISAFPGSAVLAVPYTESLALALIAGYLLTLINRRYWIGLIPIAMLGLTRGVTLPLLFVLVWHIWRRSLNRNSKVASGIEIRAGQWIAVAVQICVLSLAAFMWPWLVDRVAGKPGSYLELQGTWRKVQFEAVPFGSWYAMFDNPVLVTLVLVILIVLTLVWTLSPWVRSFGPELQAWTGAYIGYLIAVVGLNTSVLRFLVLSILFPVLFFRSAKSSFSVAIIFVVMLGLQFAYVVFAWSTPGASP